MVASRRSSHPTPVVPLPPEGGMPVQAGRDAPWHVRSQAVFSTQIYTDLERFLSVIMSHTEFTESHRIILYLLCILCSFFPSKIILMAFDEF